jgi:addiction module RelB/DinJ family antitoxin
LQTKTVTVTFRTEPEIKEQAETVFNPPGLSLSSAMDMFLHQTVNEKRYPCLLDSGIAGKNTDAATTYPAVFFELFGTASFCRQSDRTE